MRRIETIATVTESGTLIAPVPDDIPPGAHRVVVSIEEAGDPREERPPLPEFSVGRWPADFSVRREDLYSVT